MTRAESNIVLFSITLCWASSYIFIKNIPGSVSTFAYLTMTAGIASIILAIVFFRKLREFNKKTLLHAFILAVIMCTGSALEKTGLSSISASSAAFVASLNIVFVPLILLMFRKAISLDNIIGIALILVGVTCTSGIKPGETLNPGFFIMLMASLCVSVYIIAVNNYSKKHDPLLLGMGQMFFTFLISFVLCTIEEPGTFFKLEYTNTLLANIFLLAFFDKAYAYIMLVFSQKYTSPISVTLISATEPVVTMVLALLIPNSYGSTELLTTAKIIGGVFILCGSAFAGLNILGGLKAKRRENMGV